MGLIHIIKLPHGIKNLFDNGYNRKAINGYNSVEVVAEVENVSKSNVD